MSLDFSKIKGKNIYLIGIKGSGMAGLAEILKSLDAQVSGSDVKEKFFTDKVLKKLEISYLEGFSEKNVPANIDLIIYSTSYNTENNPEFKLAKEKNFPMMSYPEAIALIFNQKFGIAVSGTHGKTTTSALLATVFKNCDIDPMAVIGSRVTEWESNALVGKGDAFVLEADEYQNKLKLYQPKGAILTSLDFDHPDTFQNFSEYKNAFSDFIGKIFKSGFAVVCGDDANVIDVTKNAQCEILKYGFSEDNDIQITNYKLQISNEIQNPNSKIQTFNIVYGEDNLGEFQINLVGKHNVLNATAVVAVSQKMNLDLEKTREALKNFKGIARRFEFIGERNGAILIDDYGHHPEEIKVTLKGAREIYPEKNIIAVFMPHSYSRTQSLLEEFAQSFDEANQVIVLDIFGSARENAGQVSSADLVKLINKYNHEKAEYLPKVEEAVEFLQNKIGRNDIVICIGAGNSHEVAEKLNSHTN